VRGVGEPPFLPLAPAILVSIHDATGIWMDEITVTPERAWRALHSRIEIERHITGLSDLQKKGQIEVQE